MSKCIKIKKECFKVIESGFDNNDQEQGEFNLSNASIPFKIKKTDFTNENEITTADQIFDYLKGAQIIVRINTKKKIQMKHLSFFLDFPNK